MKENYQIYLPYQFHQRPHSVDRDAKLSNKKMKTMFLSNMSKIRRLTSTFFPIKHEGSMILFPLSYRMSLYLCVCLSVCLCICLFIENWISRSLWLYFCFLFFAPYFVFPIVSCPNTETTPQAHDLKFFSSQQISPVSH